MNIQQCLDRLANGELANTTFVCDDQIADTKVPYIISLLNEALLRLYSRFILKLDTVFVEMNEVRTRYELTKDHVYTKDINDIYDPKHFPCVKDYNKYIFESLDHPFTEDIIKILSVTRDDGFEYPLNDSTKMYSVFTPEFNVVQVPLPIPNAVISVEYQAKHPIITEDNLDMELELPEAFYGALFAYIAHSAYSSLQSENALAQAQKYYSTYMALLDELVTFDIGNTSYSQTNTKFYNNGWC